MNITAIATKEHGITPLTNIVSSESIINLIYPVGATFISFDAQFNPNTTWTGTTWELQKEGIFIEATQVDGNVGVETEAGAPNITGKFSKGGLGGRADNKLFKCTTTANGIGLGGGGGGTNEEYTMDASQYNPIYGKSNTIQPYSVKAKVWKRTA